MMDQAHRLRGLVSELAPADDFREGALPMIVVAGSRAGVGVTTVAINLSAVLADQGEAALMVDGTQHNHNLGDLAGVRRAAQFGLTDVAAGTCDVHDAIMPGPAGIRILPASGGLSTKREHESLRDATARREFSRGNQQRCLNQLQSLGEAFDLLIVDAGHGDSPWMQRLWSRASLVVMVTTPADAAVLDCYAAIKKRSADVPTQAVRLLVNLAENDVVSRRTHARIETACQTFLSRSLPALPALPRHCASDFVDFHAPPRVWEMPNSPFGHAMLWLGRAVTESVGTADTGYGVQAHEKSTSREPGGPHPVLL